MYPNWSAMGGAESAAKHLLPELRSKASLQTKCHALAHQLNSAVFVALLPASLACIPLLWAKVNNLVPTAVFNVGAVLSLLVISLVYYQAHLLEACNL